MMRINGPQASRGGIIPTKDKKYRSQALVLLEKDSATADDTIVCSVTHNGREYEIGKRIAPLGNPDFNGTTYVDLMSPEVVREFIACTHEQYKKHCGKHFGKTIPGIFTDEPCYLLVPNYDVPVVPWSDFLPDFFQEMKGYDIRQHVKELFFDVGDYQKIRFDFYDAADTLFNRNFTQQYYAWCEKNNVIFTGHFVAEDMLIYQTQWSGDVMAHHEFMHWPGIDKLGRHIEELVSAKQLTSATDQLGKERAFCEMYGCVGGQVSFFHRKWIGDWQAALGINFVNPHLSLYSMRGERKRDFPANLFYQQPWWEDEKGFADYQARMCVAASEGKRLVDILVIQPLTSLWCEFSPLHQDNGFTGENSFDKPFEHLSKELMSAKLDFHYGNETLMARHASVDNGQLNVGKHAYRCVIVPPCANLRSSTLQFLQDFCETGGKLAFVSRMPDRVDGVATPIDIPGATFLRSIGEAVRWADGLVLEHITVTDTYTGLNARSIYVHSRTLGKSVRHLLVNTDEKRELIAKVHIPDCTDIAVFDLFNGELYQMNAVNGDFDVIFAPAGSMLVICGEEAKQATQTAPPILGSGVSFTDFAGSMPQAVMDAFDCEVLEDNVLLLNDFALDVDNVRVYEGSVRGAWHEHFYNLPEGTPFRATYTFYSESEIEGCTAILEVAENLDSITFNGEQVQALKTKGEMGTFDAAKSWKDLNFTRVPLPRLQKGINTLVIAGRKSNNIAAAGCHLPLDNWQEHKPTEAEEAYICGKFSLKRISEGQFGISEFRQPQGKNLTIEGFPFYSGRIRLNASFNLAQVDDRMLLRLNSINFASARVKINNIECGTLRWSPFVCDITHAAKAGENTIEIELATTLVNAFGPNRATRIKENTWIGPYAFIDKTDFQRDYVFFDFGLQSAAVFTWT